MTYTLTGNYVETIEDNIIMREFETNVPDVLVIAEFEPTFMKHMKLLGSVLVRKKTVLKESVGGSIASPKVYKEITSATANYLIPAYLQLL